MRIGADYYPEHWPRERWDTDAALMQKAGFNVVRLAEFAWVMLEPEEGRFDFAWLDEALAVLRKRGISAILGTPTAIVPAWAARKYPEVLATSREGQRIRWGVRKDTCYTSGAFRRLSERIVRAMAEHFSTAPNVIGWQTDNEFGHPFCYCDTCRGEFQDWLRAKHQTLDALNRAWGAHFWGHTYKTWGEIELPGNDQRYNPSLCLDWQRFYSWLNVRFQRDQVRILRECCPKHFVTHNFMGLFPELNYYDLAEDLDFVSWDNYPLGGAPKGEPLAHAAAAADLMRGLKRRNFWIMEQTAGPTGASTFSRNPRPGEIRRVAWQQVAHGADGMVWFRWRTCTAGREQYWHGLLGHDGKPLRRYREAAQTARELHKLARELDGTTVRARVAMIYDYDSLWAARIQPGFPQNAYREAVLRYYRPLLRAGINVDMVRPDQDLSGYRLVIAPDLYVLPDAAAKRLNDYVAAGGVLLADCRAAVKDENSLCHARTLPGLLSEALGIAIEEYEALPDNGPYTVAPKGGLASAALPAPLTAIHYTDWITPKGAETLAAYTDWHMKRFAALTRNRHGKGWGYYLGTIVKESAFYDALIAELLAAARVKPLVRPPEGVEASVRQGRVGGAMKKLLFLINHTEQKQTVTITAGKRELLTGKKTGETIELGVYGVAVIRM